jgi:photosystem II stability/assembly factor-like uncharacterized protein
MTLMTLRAASATAEQWRYLGPGWRGSRNTIAVDPTDANVAYVGNALGRGISKTTDGGATWRATSFGLGYITDPTYQSLFMHEVNGIAIDPTNPETIYLATDDGVFKRTSPDAAFVQQAVPFVDIFTRLDGLAISPSNPQVLYTGGLFAGIFKTVDGGNHWTNVTANFPYGKVYGIAIHPTNPQIAYATNLNYGIYKTVDGGAHWVLKGGAVSPDSPEAVAIDPLHPDTVWVGDDDGAYKSVNGGDTWTLSREVDYPGYEAIAVDPTDPNKVYAGGGLLGGVARTANGGGLWSPEAKPGSFGNYVYEIQVAPSSPNVVYAAVGYSVWKSTDSGASFEIFDFGLRVTEFFSLAVHAANATVYAGGNTVGAFRSTTGGESWEPVPSGLPANASVWDFATHPTAGGTAWAALSGGVYKTTNSGGSWTSSSTGLPAGAVVTILRMHPPTPATLYAGVQGSGVYKSVDGGAHWDPANSGLPAGAEVDALAIHPATPSTLYASTFQNFIPHVFKSTNGGDSWTPAETGLPTSGTVDSLFVLPGSPATIFAGAAGKLYRSTDGGAHWTAAGTGLPDEIYLSIVSIVSDPGTGIGRVLYAATNYGGFSVDLTGLPAALYLGYGGNGVFRSTDGGATWKAFNAGFATNYVAGVGLLPPLLHTLALGSTHVAPVGLAVDPAGNGILEPGENAKVVTSWKNLRGAALPLAGTATEMKGDYRGIYAIADNSAGYGTLAAGASASCTATNDCFTVRVTHGVERTPGDWDAFLMEAIDTGEPAKKWRLHVGETFVDVPRSNPFYTKIETVLHQGLTFGCSLEGYCPAGKLQRDQMAIFLARGIAGGSQNIPGEGTVNGQPYACGPGGSSVFSDVDSEDTFCKAVHYIAAQNVTSGCSAGHYCPSDLTSRSAMAIFVAKAIVAPGGGAAVPMSYGPDPVTGFSYSCNAGSSNLHFIDVKVTDSYCKHVHFLWAKGIIAGCSSNQYCPNTNLGRDEMAKFLANAFALQLYGP